MIKPAPVARKQPYPVYDGHGNMIATLTFNRPGLSANGLYEVPTSYGVQLGNLRRYDVWGGVRGGQQTGYPNHRYCANLGHKVDDETGLIYMRARYYEPSTGRFISEDPARDGWNWYRYANNCPAELVDRQGTISVPIYLTYMAAVGALAGATSAWVFNMLAGRPTTPGDIVAGALSGALLGLLGAGLPLMTGATLTVALVTEAVFVAGITSIATIGVAALCGFVARKTDEANGIQATGLSGVFAAVLGSQFVAMIWLFAGSEY